MKKYVYKLKVLEGPEKGKSFFLADDRYTLGRDKENSICIVDLVASKYHCEIIRSGDHYYMKDLRSRNGTFLNGIRIAAKQLYDIPPGSEIKIGGTLMHVGMEEVDESEEADLDQDTMESEVPAAQAMGSPTAYMGVAPGRSPGRVRKMKERTIPFTVDTGRNVAGVYKVLSIIGSTADRDFLMEKSVDLIMEIVDAERGFLFLREDLTRYDIKPAVGRTVKESGEVPVESISQTVIATVFGEGSAVLITDLPSDHRFSKTDSLIGFNIRSVICAPIKSREEILGLLYFDTTSQTGLLKREDLDFITAIGIQIGIIMENMDLMYGYQDIFVEFAKVMVDLHEAKSRYYAGHSSRVARISIIIADGLNLAGKRIEDIHLAALLHDIGQFLISEEIINKEGKLDGWEFDLIKKHPAKGKSLIANIQTFDRAADGILYHHERLDGSGYPVGLREEKIPLVARIIAVAEVFDALTSPRPYRNRLTEEAAIRELLKEAGIKFDLNVVQALRRAFEDGKILPRT